MPTNNLPAGSELDTRIAKLLGWKCIEEDDASQTLYKFVLIDQEGYKDEWGHTEEETWEKGPRYSTDGNAMLKLIEAMRERGWLINARPLIDGYVATAMPINPQTGQIHQALGDSLPHCAGLAALAALEGENAR